MTDRFAAQLRQHLLDAADEQPAHGQLATVIDGVASTRQRHSLAARLTWDADRIGPFPSAALRYSLIAVALALATVAGAILAGGTSRSTTVFEGTWITIDPGDGSGMTLVVGAGQTPDVYFEDGYASGDACTGDAVKRYTARGTGAISGDRLRVEYPDGGGCGLARTHIGGRYDYIEELDALVDQDGLAWTRALAEQEEEAASPTTQTPDTTPVPDETTTPETPSADRPGSTESALDQGQKCSDVPAGGTYANDVNGVSLAVTIPATAAFRWQGDRPGFGLEDYCFAGGPVVITASAVELIYGSCGHTAGRPPSAAVAVEWLTGSDDYTASEPHATTIDGYPATRFEISFDRTPCPEESEFELWSGRDFNPGDTWIVVIVDVDVDGVPLGIVIRNRGGDAPAAQVAEAEAIVATMEIAR